MLCTISTSGMVTSLVIVDNIQGRTHIVNQIGSIRMLIYKSISSAKNQTHSEDIQTIKSTLSEYKIKEYMIESKLNIEYSDLINFFHTNIEDKDIKSIKFNSEEFVKKTNNLIDKVEHNTEKNIKSLENIQKLFSILVIIFGLYAIRNLYSRLFKPWMSLLDILRSIKSGDFSKKFIVQKNKDEMNELGDSINLMSDSLKEIYLNLEQLVYQKTEDLNQKNKYLYFLYRACKMFNNEQYSCDILAPLIKELLELTSICSVTILIKDYQESESNQIFDFGSLNRPIFCKNSNCNLCFDEKKRPIENVFKTSIKLKDSTNDYGEIIISSNY